MERKFVYEVVDVERKYQDETWASSTGKSVGDYLCLMDTYLRSAQDAYTHNKGDITALEQIRKLAALAVCSMEVHGAPGRLVPMKIFYSSDTSGDLITNLCIDPLIGTKEIEKQILDSKEVKSFLIGKNLKKVIIKPGTSATLVV